MPEKKFNAFTRAVDWVINADAQFVKFPAMPLTQSTALPTQEYIYKYIPITMDIIQLKGKG